jgi:glycosyltransferase involved in cell wall biosynthesis
MFTAPASCRSGTRDPFWRVIAGRLPTRIATAVCSVRVLHVHSGNLYGGVETLLLSLARFRMLAPSMEMAVALTSEGRIAADLRRAGVLVTILGDTRMSRPFSVRRARQALTSLLRSNRPDVVVCHQAWPLALFGPVARRESIPLVLWMHMAAGRHWLDRLAWRVRPDMIVCNSRFTATTLPTSRIPVEVVYAPLDLQSARAEHTRSHNGCAVIIQVSRMEPLKGHAILLDALGELRNRPGWLCRLAGGAQRSREDHYMASLRARTADLGIADRVEFLGDRSDVHRLLAGSDIYCQPNVEPEAFGISLIEALAAGLPVVTSALGGAKEIVDETCGLLVPPRDSAILASRLSTLLDDRVCRERLGAHGPARARALCDPAAQMPRIAGILQTAAAQ